jgi:hypothetical protein
VGDYSQAEHWFAASMTADETYMRDQHVAVDDDWNYVHNMMYAIANLMEQGKLSDANALSDHLSAARGQLSATLYIWSARDQMARINRRLPVALRIADWDTALALLSQANLPEGDKTANLRFLASELSDFATGMKALDKSDVAAAQAASDRMDAGLWRTKHDTDAVDEEKKKLPTPRPVRCSKLLASHPSNCVPESWHSKATCPKQRRNTPPQSPKKRSSATTSRPCTFAPSAKTKP